MGTQHEPQDEYSFIQETIKDEEFNPRKWVAKLGRVLLLGLVFGIAACIAFFALKPWAEETFQKEPSKVDLDIEDQEKYMGIKNLIDKQKFELEKQKQNYIDLKKGLMQQLLTGKLKV